MKKWWRDTENGLSTNPFCRSILIELIVTFALFAFIGWGYIFVWQAMVYHLLAAWAPFSLKIDRLLRRIGVPFVPYGGLKNRSQGYRWYFVGRRLLTGSAILIAGLYVVAKANFGLVSLLWLVMSR